MASGDPCRTARRVELRAALGPRALLVSRRLELGARAIEFLSVDDIDPLLSELEELELTDPLAAIERLPYWASLWPSSIALAQVLLADRDGLAGSSALELGCGAGLASLAAHFAGARVLATDHQPPALQLSELNFLLNGSDAFEGRLLDWRSPPSDLCADLVLCSDVAYEREVLTALATTLEAVCAPSGRVLLAEPRRPVARGLFALLAERGWLSSTQAVAAQLDGRSIPVDVHTFRRERSPGGRGGP